MKAVFMKSMFIFNNIQVNSNLIAIFAKHFNLCWLYGADDMLFGVVLYIPF